MHKLVRFKIPRSGEGLGAKAALMWLVLEVFSEIASQLLIMSHLVVSHLVVVEVAGSCKSLSAHPTLMWLFPAVNSPETGASALLFLYISD